MGTLCASPHPTERGSATWSRLPTPCLSHLPCGPLGVGVEEVVAAPQAQAGAPGCQPAPVAGVCGPPEHRQAVSSAAPPCQDSEKWGGEPHLGWARPHPQRQPRMTHGFPATPEAPGTLRPPAQPSRLHRHRTQHVSRGTVILPISKRRGGEFNNTC